MAIEGFLSSFFTAIISSGVCATIVYAITSKVVEKAAAKTIDDRIDKKIVPIQEKWEKDFKDLKNKEIDEKIDVKLNPTKNELITFEKESKKTFETQWNRIDEFKKNVEEKYLAKETFKVYNECGAQALKDIKDTVVSLAEKFDKYILSKGDNR